MINQRLDAFKEAHGMRQSCVDFERVFVNPAGVNVKQPRILDRAKSVNFEASGFLPRRTDNLQQGLGDGFLVSGEGMKAGKNEQLHQDQAAPPADDLAALYMLLRSGRSRMWLAPSNLLSDWRIRAASLKWNCASLDLPAIAIR